MENQKMPEYETIRAAVAGEKWAVEKVVECYKDEIDRLSTVAVRQPDGSTKQEINEDMRQSTYISYGELYFTGSKDDFVDMFRIVKGGIEELSDDLKNKAAGIRTFPTGFEALMKTEDISGFPNLTVDPATIDEIVVFTSKKGDDYE